MLFSGETHEAAGDEVFDFVSLPRRAVEGAADDHALERDRRGPPPPQRNAGAAADRRHRPLAPHAVGGGGLARDGQAGGRGGGLRSGPRAPRCTADYRAAAPPVELGCGLIDATPTVGVRRIPTLVRAGHDGWCHPTAIIDYCHRTTVGPRRSFRARATGAPAGQ